MRVIRISSRPFSLVFPVERETLYNRIKKLLKRAEVLANIHENVKVKLKAMEVAVRLAMFLEGVLEHLQLEEIQSELEELEKTEG